MCAGSKPKLVSASQLLVSADGLACVDAATRAEQLIAQLSANQEFFVVSTQYLLFQYSPCLLTGMGAGSKPKLVSAAQLVVFADAMTCVDAATGAEKFISQLSATKNFSSSRHTTCYFNALRVC